MISAWTKHLIDDKDKILFENQLLGSKTILDRLKDLLKEQLDALDRSEMDPSVYDTPNWENRQAHKNGFRSCIQRINKLLDIQKEIK